MTRACRHENADHLSAGMWFIDMDGEPVEDVLCEQLRCMDCRSWLPLGPANDDSEAVRVEILAAGLAVDDDSLAFGHVCTGKHECVPCQAWRLAFVIAEHRDGQIVSHDDGEGE